MAVVKIKTIKSNLQAVINCGKNGDKTDNGILVSSINCSTETAYEEMALTKKFFHKENKTLGYHIIQSFKGNEVSPEKANQIGKQLAEELWGDKYQVVICTHINKQNVHNHIILNSVSFVDGKKYHNSDAEIAFMKQASDRLCFNNGLSIINTSKSQKENEFRQNHIDYFNRRSEKMQKVINDIDEAIKSVKKYSDFKLVLKSKGYENIKDTGKYFTMKTPYFQRNVRIDRAFGDMYSVQGIKDRIYGYTKEEKIKFANYKKKYYRKIYTGPKLNKFLLQTSSFYRLYVHYLYKFGKLPAKIQAQELTPEYFKEKRKNNMIFEELNFLSRRNFQSINEVENYRTNLEDQLSALKSKRENLWRKYNKTTDNIVKNTIKTEINKLTERIDIITAQRNACNRIIDRYPIIKEEYKKGISNNEKAKELILNDRRKKSKNR
ncbi:MAG: relaxase/mobilization nuclease domain-containing protein [Clostridia bacterium]|nr:relaxase/mobilization nuclease domain-containing protein [Clostridia bacterium]